MSFADLFKAAVDINSELKKSEKLKYLKACVKGGAARLISSISITDQNYLIAMDMLTERYANKRSIVQAHLQKLWTQPSMKTEYGHGLRKLLETTNEHLPFSEELGEPAEKWGSILVFLISGKKDSESRKQWQLDNPGTDLLCWKQLSKF